MILKKGDYIRVKLSDYKLKSSKLVGKEFIGKVLSDVEDLNEQTTDDEFTVMKVRILDKEFMKKYYSLRTIYVVVGKDTISKREDWSKICRIHAITFEVNEIIDIIVEEYDSYNRIELVLKADGIYKLNDKEKALHLL